MFIDFRERERGRERQKHQYEKHQLVASRMCLDRGSNLQPSFVPWLGIEPVQDNARTKSPNQDLTLFKDGKMEAYKRVESAF